MRALIFLFCIVAVSDSTALRVDSTPRAPAVNTSTGNYVGLVHTEYAVNMYKGIRYAAAPVGTLRFAPTAVQPYPEASQQTPMEAFDFQAGCYQKCNDPYGPNRSYNNFTCTSTISEDCLFLNVYTPTNSSQANPGNELLPVIFFIHGGSFNWGSGGTMIYDGTEWASRENVVVVTINYRLNLFGALSTRAIQGNFQLEDQRHALGWVQSNIALFGGDKTRVMVSGESAGAMSVGMHLVSPTSWDLYSSAAVISDPYAITPITRVMAEARGQDVITYLQCDAATTSEFTSSREIDAAVLRCLQGKTSEEILNASLTIKPATPKGVPWMPHVDGRFVAQQPLVAAKEGNIANVPLYIGNNANESVLFVYSEFTEPLPLDDLKDITALQLGLNASEEIFSFYPPETPAEKVDSRGLFSRLQTDFLFYCPTRRIILDAYASPKFTANIYYYLFDHVPSYTHWSPSWEFIHCAEDNVCHFVGMPFIFDSTKYLAEEAQPNAEEKDLILFMQKAWAAVARSGELPAEMNWKPFNNQTLLAYNLSTPVVASSDTQVSAYRAKFCDFWDKFGYHE